MSIIHQSFSTAYACLAAWSDLLDRINVFPVADGDTGTNLRISLAPLRQPHEDIATTCKLLARCATGNSGNIAAAFFREFCRAERIDQLGTHALLGREKAWQSIARPCPGTMLTVFDSLAEGLKTHADPSAFYAPLCLALQQSVFSTTQLLADLQKAEVVDSGALAMYIFFEGFFRHLGQQTENGSILDIFAGRLAISGAFNQEKTDCFCVDAVIRLDENSPPLKDLQGNQTAVRDKLAKLGESLVVVQDASFLKVHIHTPDPVQLRGQLSPFGNIVQWNDGAIDQHRSFFAAEPDKASPLHIVTDAAGSLPREMALDLGITLLDSYIIVGDDSRPESLYSPEHIYPLMRKGIRITTAQAANIERQQHYQNICQEFGPSLYLAVGSAFTGNYDTAVKWQKENALGRLLMIIDTGAASGRLALIALLTARYAQNCRQPEDIIAAAEVLVNECREYVFINELKYLVAGGRVSKAGGFFGDILHMKPIVSPTRSGVKKAGLVRNIKGQVAFALEKLRKHCERSAAPVVLLQYSDNETWVTDYVQEQVRSLLPQAEILLTPLSLTSGVHMGPGTWSLAFAEPAALKSDGKSR